MLVEAWKKDLDNQQHVGAVLMDLSKAFDCLPHDRIIAKVNGLTAYVCKFLYSYLSNRKQRIKLGQIHSSWMNILKGVTQGSILGPLIFNVFINDIFYFIKKNHLFITMRMTTLCHIVTKP